MFIWCFYIENAFCAHLTVCQTKNCGGGCQTNASAKGFAKRSIEPRTRSNENSLPSLPLSAFITSQVPLSSLSEAGRTGGSFSARGVEKLSLSASSVLWICYIHSAIKPRHYYVKVKETCLMALQARSDAYQHTQNNVKWNEKCLAWKYSMHTAGVVMLKVYYNRERWHWYSNWTVSNIHRVIKSNLFATDDAKIAAFYSCLDALNHPSKKSIQTISAAQIQNSQWDCCFYLKTRIWFKLFY